MHDETAMRSSNGDGDFIPQVQACIDAKLPGIAMRVNRVAGNIFERKPGKAIGTDATIQQSGDARIVQARQDLPLLLEPGNQIRRRQPRPQAFDRGELLETTYGTFGVQHACHAAVGNGAACPPGAETLARSGIVGNLRPQSIIEDAGQRIGIGFGKLQHRTQVCDKLRLHALDTFHEARPFKSLETERPPQHRIQLGELADCKEFVHGASSSPTQARARLSSS